jgi:hypothetical protein
MNASHFGSAVARKADQLDLFVVGLDGRVYTTWWSEGNDWFVVTDDWRPIGGFFPAGAPVSAVARKPEQLDLFVVGNDGRAYTSWWSGGEWSGINDNWRPLAPTTLSHFTFAGDISAENRDRLIARHRFALSRISWCNNLTAEEKAKLNEVYQRAIHHTTLNDANANASAQVGGSQLNVNFGVLFPQGDEEISQTLIHEMMHCAGFRHPARRDPPAGSSCAAPNPAVFDCPNDNGQYYGTPPLRAEFCIAGDQSDVLRRLEHKASDEKCHIGDDGIATIYKSSRL